LKNNTISSISDWKVEIAERDVPKGTAGGEMDAERVRVVESCARESERDGGGE
jgi:hypothetical protein